MHTAEELKSIVKDSYTKVVTEPSGSCCGPCGCDADTSFAESYVQLEGYVPEADYGLGCGLPADGADIRPGMTVVDLGSGAGNDAFVIARMVGADGKVIGVDFTPAMLDKARANARKQGVRNVEFVEGDIENIPQPEATADLVVSNCVLNLLPDKRQGFAEMYRILKPGGRFSVSDIVTEGNLPAGIRRVAELYAGCVSGAVDKKAYIGMLSEAGFTDVVIRREKEYTLSDELLVQHLSPNDRDEFRASGAKVVSVTVAGRKAG